MQNEKEYKITTDFLKELIDKYIEAEINVDKSKYDNLQERDMYRRSKNWLESRIGDIHG